MYILGNLYLNILLSLNWKSASLPLPYLLAIVQGIAGLKCPLHVRPFIQTGLCRQIMEDKPRWSEDF